MRSKGLKANNLIRLLGMKLTKFLCGVTLKFFGITSTFNKVTILFLISIFSSFFCNLIAFIIWISSIISTKENHPTLGTII